MQVRRSFMPIDISGIIDRVMIKIKRVYETYSSEDGYRVLVDRLWPRGVSKQNAHIDEWLKAIAPSNELRTWFNHEVDKWPEFQKRYAAELNHNTATSQLADIIKDRKHVTLVYSARDEQHNQAVVLQSWLKQK